MDTKRIVYTKELNKLIEIDQIAIFFKYKKWNDCFMLVFIIETIFMENWLLECSF